MPSKLRTRILKLAHEGHQGIVKTKMRLREKVWWPDMDKNVETFCRSCHSCQLVGEPSKPEFMKRTELPRGPWQDVSIDLCGPFPGGENLLVVVDYYSRWTEVCVMKKTTTSKIINCLRHMFATHGLVKTITSDNGPQFTSTEFKNYLEENGIKHRRVTPYWPAANGGVERQNRTLLKAIRTAYIEGKDWKSELLTFLVAYRSTPHTVTGVSPAELMYNRKMRTKLPDDFRFAKNMKYAKVRQRDAEHKQKGKIYADTKRHAAESDLKVGDSVLVKQQRENKLTPNFQSNPYVVTDKRGNAITARDTNGTVIKRNVTHVKKYIKRENDSEGQSCEIETNDEKVYQHENELSQADSRPKRNTKRPKYLEDYICD